MKLPFSVYTAQQGYGWVSGLEHGRAALERYRKALGKFPEADYGDAMTCGAVNADDIVVAYRFLTAQKWDSKGRNALYLAMTFFPRAGAGEIDFEQLLGMELFTKPMREPPSSLEYCGGESAGSGYDPENDTGAGTVAIDLSCAGSVFKKAFPGTLKIWREDGAGRVSCAYTRPVAVADEPAVRVKPSGQPVSLPVQAPNVTSAPVPVSASWWSKWGEAVAAAVMVTLVAGYVVWMKSDLFRLHRARPISSAISEGGKPVSWSCWLVGSDGHWRGLRDIPPYGACREVILGGKVNRRAHD